MAFHDVSLRHKRVWVFRGPQDVEALRSLAEGLVADQVVTEAALDLRSSGPGPALAVPGPGEMSALLHLYGMPAGEDARDASPLAAAHGAQEYGILERVVFDRRRREGELAWSQGWVRVGTQVRQPHLDRAGFIAHWGAVHAELVRAHHPGAVRYVQSYRLWSVPRAAEFDGFYESYFPTEADWTERLFDSPLGEKLLSEDADGFLDDAGSERLWITKERFGPSWDEFVPRQVR